MDAMRDPLRAGNIVIVDGEARLDGTAVRLQLVARGALSLSIAHLLRTGQLLPADVLAARAYLLGREERRRKRAARQQRRLQKLARRVAALLATDTGRIPPDH